MYLLPYVHRIVTMSYSFNQQIVLIVQRLATFNSSKIVNALNISKTTVFRL